MACAGLLEGGIFCEEQGTQTKTEGMAIWK